MRTVADIMEPDVYFVFDDTPLARVAEMFSERQISGAPVCSREGRILGVISKTDLVELYGSEHEEMLARDVMTTHVFAVKPDDGVDQAIKLMAFEGVHRLIVLDEEHRLVGLVTSMDVLRELAGFRREPRVEAVAPPKET